MALYAVRDLVVAARGAITGDYAPVVDDSDDEFDSLEANAPIGGMLEPPTSVTEAVFVEDLAEDVDAGTRSGYRCRRRQGAPLMTLALLIIIMLVLLALRVPVWTALLAISVGYMLFNGSGGGAQVVQRLTSGLDSFPLLAVPFFILAGVIMAGGGVAERLLGFATTLVGHYRGGLAQVNVLNSFMMGGMSGSANADAAVDAKILVPVMRRQGYTNAFASAITVASGSIAPILPPSIGLILYGVLGGVSIGDLFIAGVIPGVLIAAALSATVWILARMHGFPRANDRRPTLGEIWARIPRAPSLRC